VALRACAWSLTLSAAFAVGASAQSARTSLDVARVLAARYPESPGMSYIPGLAWAGAFQLASITGESQWITKPRREMQPFLTGERPAIAEPYALTSLAGHLAFADLGSLEGNVEATVLARRAADFILSEHPDTIVRFGRGWTDDMYMASALLSRVAQQVRRRALRASARAPADELRGEAPA
jgi:hypothetical protein